MSNLTRYVAQELFPVLVQRWCRQMELWVMTCLKLKTKMERQLEMFSIASAVEPFHKYFKRRTAAAFMNDAS